ncbi:SMEK domain-containing protein [Paraclostridium bifermentans]|nr:SMEK domain-containing protein [Paraclostridium bifermentans]
MIGIKRRLHEVAQGIKENNKINLTDINVICEEIFGKILNEIFDINLVSMSAEVSGKFYCS